MSSTINKTLSSAARSGAKDLAFRYGLGFLFNIVGTVVIARQGGPELWGLFAISQVALTVFSVISHGCWGFIIQNSSAPTEEEIGNCYFIQSVLSAFWAIFVLAVAPFLSGRLSAQGLVPLILATVVGGFFYGWRYIVCGLSERNLQYRVAARAELSDIIVFNVVAVLFTVIGHPFLGILAGNLLRGVISLSVALASSKQHIFFRYQRGTFRRITRFSIPYAGFVALQWFPIYAGPVVAGSLLSIRELGILQLAYKTVEYPRVLLTVAFRLSTSVFSRMEQASEQVERNVKRVLDMLFLLLVPTMGVLVGLSHIWVPLIYGDDWKDMSSIMTIIVVPYLLMAMMMIISSLLSSLGSVRTSFLFYIVYNVIYWPALIAMTGMVGFYGAPYTEWIALISLPVLILAMRSIPLRWNALVRNATTVTAAGGGIVLLRQISLTRSPLESLALCGLLMALWVAFSPAKKELTEWVYRQHALDAEK